MIFDSKKLLLLTLIMIFVSVIVISNMDNAVTVSDVKNKDVYASVVKEFPSYIESDMSDGTIEYASKTPSVTVAEAQVIDISKVKDGSKVKDVVLSVNLNGDSSKSCSLVLDDDFLDKERLSDSFSCYGLQSIQLNKNAVNAIEFMKITGKDLKIAIQEDSTKTKLSVPVLMNVTYAEPTYFAEIVNSTVVNVIVAEQDYIDTLPGIYVKTDINGNYAGVGNDYDGKCFIPKNSDKDNVISEYKLKKGDQLNYFNSTSCEWETGLN